MDAAFRESFAKLAKNSLEYIYIYKILSPTLFTPYRPRDKSLTLDIIVGTFESRKARKLDVGGHRRDIQTTELNKASLDSARLHRSLESFPRDYANISPLPHWFFSFPSTLLPTSTFHHLFSYIELQLLLCARVYPRSTRKTMYIYIYVRACVCIYTRTRVKRDKTDALASSFFPFSNYRQRRYITETRRYLETFHFLKKKIRNFVITLLSSLSSTGDFGHRRIVYKNWYPFLSSFSSTPPRYFEQTPSIKIISKCVTLGQ